MIGWRTWLERLPESGPRTLAAIRIVVALQALWIVLSRDPAGVSALPEAIWRGIPDATRLRFLLVPGIPVVETIVWACAVASLGCVLVGWRTRTFGIAAALLLYHIAPLQTPLSVAGTWWLAIGILALPILACSPCEDRWSVSARGAILPERDALAYDWPVFLVRFLFALIYLFTALGRIALSGFDWASVDAVRTHILVFRLMYPHLDHPLGDWLVAHPAACAAMSAGILAFEATFIAAVFVRRLRLPLAVAGVGMHVGLWLTLGFRYLNLPLFIMFLDLDPTRRAPEHRTHGNQAGTHGARAQQGAQEA